MKQKKQKCVGFLVKWQETGHVSDKLYTTVNRAIAAKTRYVPGDRYQRAAHFFANWTIIPVFIDV